MTLINKETQKYFFRAFPFTLPSSLFISQLVIHLWQKLNCYKSCITTLSNKIISLKIILILHGERKSVRWWIRMSKQTVYSSFALFEYRYLRAVLGPKRVISFHFLPTYISKYKPSSQYLEHFCRTSFLLMKLTFFHSACCCIQV
jgi:hypothetical protein